MMPIISNDIFSQAPNWSSLKKAAIATSYGASLLAYSSRRMTFIKAALCFHAICIVTLPQIFRLKNTTLQKIIFLTNKIAAETYFHMGIILFPAITLYNTSHLAKLNIQMSIYTAFAASLTVGVGIPVVISLIYRCDEIVNHSDWNSRLTFLRVQFNAMANQDFSLRPLHLIKNTELLFTLFDKDHTPEKYPDLFSNISLAAVYLARTNNAPKFLKSLYNHLELFDIAASQVKKYLSLQKLLNLALQYPMSSMERNAEHELLFQKLPYLVPMWISLNQFLSLFGLEVHIKKKIDLLFERLEGIENFEKHYNLLQQKFQALKTKPNKTIFDTLSKQFEAMKRDVQKAQSLNISIHTLLKLCVLNSAEGGNTIPPSISQIQEVLRQKNWAAENQLLNMEASISKLNTLHKEFFSEEGKVFKLRADLSSQFRNLEEKGAEEDELVLTISIPFNNNQWQQVGTLLNVPVQDIQNKLAEMELKKEKDFLDHQILPFSSESLNKLQAYIQNYQGQHPLVEVPLPVIQPQTTGQKISGIIFRILQSGIILAPMLINPKAIIWGFGLGAASCFLHRKQWVKLPSLSEIYQAALSKKNEFLASENLPESRGMKRRPLVKIQLLVVALLEMISKFYDRRLIIPSPKTKLHMHLFTKASLLEKFSMVAQGLFVASLIAFIHSTGHQAAQRHDLPRVVKVLLTSNSNAVGLFQGFTIACELNEALG